MKPKHNLVPGVRSMQNVKDNKQNSSLQTVNQTTTRHMNGKVDT